MMDAIEHQKLAVGSEKLIYQIEKACKGKMCLVADDKNKDVSYIIPRETYLSTAENLMVDDTFTENALPAEEILENIQRLAKTGGHVAPTNLPYAYFSFKGKCWKCTDGACGYEHLCNIVGKKIDITAGCGVECSMVRNVCSSADSEGHKCARRIVSTATAYTKPANKKLKGLSSDLRAEVDTIFEGLPERPDDSDIYEAYVNLSIKHDEHEKMCPECGCKNERVGIYTFDATSCFERITEEAINHAINTLRAESPHLSEAIEQMAFDIRQMRHVTCGRKSYTMGRNGSPIGLRWSGLICRAVFRLAESRSHLWSSDLVKGFRYEDDLLVLSRCCRSCLSEYVSSSYPHPFVCEGKCEKIGESISWTTKMLTLKVGGMVGIERFRKSGWQDKIKPFDPKDVRYARSLFLGLNPDRRVVDQFILKGFPPKMIRHWLARCDPSTSPTELVSKKNLERIKREKKMYH